MLPRTKIVATIGPACWDEPTLRALLLAGVAVVRFNFSHAEYGTTAEKMALVRRVADEEGLNVAILADLQGPRIRVGHLPEQGVMLTSGTQVTLVTTPSNSQGNSAAIPVDYPGLTQDVFIGDTVLLDDGLISLQVTDVAPALGEIICEVVVGGRLTSHKGINVPARPLGVPTITDKDQADLAFALEHGADMLALSFVRAGSDVANARRLAAAQTARAVPIISKIEKAAAVDNFAEILAESDGIMVARGDMGVEMPAEVLPAIQKRIISAANVAGKPVITATQMLDSMVRNPGPTRAEATDVANAVLDGTDAVMLSGETAVGKYPVPAVQTMARIAYEAEKLFDYEGWTARMAGLTSPSAHQHHQQASGDTSAAAQEPDMRQITEVICQSADRIGDRLGARAIIAITHSGTTARLVAKYRPAGRLIGITDRVDTQRGLAVTWGVHALLLDRFDDTLVTIEMAERLAMSRGLIVPGDLLVFTSGLPEPMPGRTTLLKVQVAGVGG